MYVREKKRFREFQSREQENTRDSENVSLRHIENRWQYNGKQLGTNYTGGKHNSSISLMFFNFPEEWGMGRLWMIFKRYGTVFDMFMYLKRLRNGQKYGFIRNGMGAGDGGFVSSEVNRKGGGVNGKYVKCGNSDKRRFRKKRKKEKHGGVKARLLTLAMPGGASLGRWKSAYSESRTISPRRKRRSRSPRHNPSVFTRLRRESEDIEGGTESLNYEEKSPVSKMMNSPNLGQQQKQRGGPCQHGVTCLIPTSIEMLECGLYDLTPESIDYYNDLRRSVLEKLPPTEEVHQRPNSAP
ncbi:hypothetical protein Tco_0569541 [Tanacetum coccineum]